MSDPGNLYCTALYPNAGTPADAAKLTFVAALAIAESLAEFIVKSKISIKWPNDVLIGGAKTCGILLESGQQNGQGWVLIGMGLNMQSHPADTPYPATHLYEHIKSDTFQSSEPDIPAPDTILPVLARHFENWRLKYQQSGFAPIRTAWQAWAKEIPGPVKVQLSQETFSGQALGLGANGELQVRLDDGTMRDVHAGDVFFEG